VRPRGRAYELMIEYNVHSCIVTVNTSPLLIVLEKNLETCEGLWADAPKTNVLNHVGWFCTVQEGTQ
jgi:hypothetical protein